MPTSHYFPLYLKNDSGEQNLVQDLVDEQIKLFGSDVYYISRKTTQDGVLGDIIFSEFNEKIVIEAFLQNVEGFGDTSEFISKFGLKITDEIRITISARRWDEEAPRLKNLEIMTRPNEGDLIYFPLTEDIYEIKFVEREQPFYQLGKVYFYTLTCEIYDVGSDDFNTGIPEIDDDALETDYSITLVLDEGGTGNYYQNDIIEYHTVGELLGNTTYTPTGITAKVADWDAPTRSLKLINITGDFAEGQAVLKQSGSSYTSDGVYIIGDQSPTVNIDDSNSQYDDNKYIEVEADDILDFTERNPFGEYGNFTDVF